MDTIAVILVNYNNDDLTEDCIKSIYQCDDRPTIILVDNSSKVFDVERFSKYQDVVIIKSKENLGFAGGNNLGIRYALKNGFDYICILNNDTVIDNSIFKELLKCASSTCIAVPKMYYYSDKNKIWFAGGYYNRFKGEAFHIGLNEIDHGQYDEIRDISFASGCCMMIHKSIIKTIGMLSEEYFMYYEDVDYCLKCQRAGIRIRYVPTAKLWHRIGSTAGTKSVLSSYYRTRNRYYIINKFKIGFLPWIFTRISRVIKYALGCIRHDSDRIIICAYIDFLKGRMGRVDIERE